jgi:hypothetical protein
MVVHFDATIILKAHMASMEFYPVTIKVVEIPSPEPKTMPWRELLSNPRYFEHPIGETSPSEIVDFIEDWQAKATDGRPHICETITLFSLFCKSPTSASGSRLLQEIIDCLGNMKKCESPGYEVVQANLLATMQKLKLTRKGPGPKEVRDIMNDFRSMRDRAEFFWRLKEPSPKCGSVHCELSLACFMMGESTDFPEEYREIAKELSVSFVSLLDGEFLSF